MLISQSFSGLLVGRQNTSRMEYKPDPEPIDPELKFYKSRTLRHVTYTVDNRPVYDFDSWYVIMNW